MGEEEEMARREMLQSALAYLEQNRNGEEIDFLDIYDDLSRHYQHRLAALSGNDDPAAALSPDHLERHARLLRNLLRTERETAIRLRDHGKINDETLRQLEYELDLREANPLAGA
jgi:CPA1 family monovalent cation:H+ antiporter